MFACLYLNISNSRGLIFGFEVYPGGLTLAFACVCFQNIFSVINLLVFPSICFVKNCLLGI